MSTGITVSWQGVDVLDEKIDLLLDIASGEEITNALMPGAQLIAERWRERVPTEGETEYATGEYHNSIHIERGPTDEFGINSLDILTDAVNPHDGFPYPEALEFGTSNMRARPSAQPAFDESVEEAIALAATQLDLLLAGSIQAAYDVGNIAQGQALNVAVGKSRGGTTQSGGAMR
jgi:HK97 gp10 family phage protein